MLLPIAIGCFVILGVQGHYWLQFRMLTTSSFGGQNAVKSMVQSGAVDADDLSVVAGNDKCLQLLSEQAGANAFFNGGAIPDSYAPCFDRGPRILSKAIVLEDFKLRGNAQYNSVRRLATSYAWNTLALRLAAREPVRVLLAPLGIDSRPSSIEVMLAPGHTYQGTRDWLKVAFPFFSLWRPFGALFPGLAIGVMLIHIVLCLNRQDAFSRAHRRFFLSLMLFLVTMIGVGAWLEYGENARFLVELYPMLLVGSALVVHTWLKDSPVAVTCPESRASDS